MREMIDFLLIYLGIGLLVAVRTYFIVTSMRETTGHPLNEALKLQAYEMFVSGASPRLIAFVVYCALFIYCIKVLIAWPFYLICGLWKGIL